MGSAMCTRSGCTSGQLLVTNGNAIWTWDPGVLLAWGVPRRLPNERRQRQPSGNSARSQHGSEGPGSEQPSQRDKRTCACHVSMQKVMVSKRQRKRTAFAASLGKVQLARKALTQTSARRYVCNCGKQLNLGLCSTLGRCSVCTIFLLLGLLVQPVHNTAAHMRLQ